MRHPCISHRSQRRTVPRGRSSVMNISARRMATRRSITFPTMTILIKSSARDLSALKPCVMQTNCEMAENFPCWCKVQARLCKPSITIPIPTPIHTVRLGHPNHSRQTQVSILTKIQLSRVKVVWSLIPSERYHEPNSVELEVRNHENAVGIKVTLPLQAPGAKSN